MFLKTVSTTAFFFLAAFSLVLISSAETKLCTNAEIGYKACLATDLCTGSPGCDAECSVDLSCCEPCAGQAAFYKQECCEDGSNNDATAEVEAEGESAVCTNAEIGWKACLATDLCVASPGCKTTCSADNDCCEPCAGQAVFYKKQCCGGGSTTVEAADTSAGSMLNVKPYIAVLLGAAAFV